MNGEKGKVLDNKQNCSKETGEKNNRNDTRKKARVNVLEANEESQIREYANIQEIKEMNNMLFYKQLVRKIVKACVRGECNNLYFIKDKINIYDNFKDGEDIFVKMDESCVWLKKEYMDATAIHITNIIGKVNMIGYVLEEESKSSPRVIKALAIYT